MNSLASKTRIISLAIGLMGHKPIQSLENADDLVVSAEQAFDLLLPSVLSKIPWRFATQIAQLSKLNIPPVSKAWSYVYSLPAGWLKTIRMHPQTYAWDIYENKQMYTNFNGEWYMEYVFQPDTQLLPESFVEYFIYEIACFLALSSAQSTGYYQILEAKRIQLQAFASASDAQNRPQGSQILFPVLANRNIATSEYSFN